MNAIGRTFRRLGNTAASGEHLLTVAIGRLRSSADTAYIPAHAKLSEQVHNSRDALRPLRFPGFMLRCGTGLRIHHIGATFPWLKT